MIGLDTGILVAHAIIEHPLHVTVRKWLEVKLDQGETFSITSGILAEFIHVVTDHRRFENPLTMSQALDLGRFWSKAREVTLTSGDEATNDLWMEWIAEFRLGRKRLLDTLIAATWYQIGVRDIATLNPADFRVFDVFGIHVIE